MGSRWGQAGVKLGFTWGQHGVNLHHPTMMLKPEMNCVVQKKPKRKAKRDFHHMRGVILHEGTQITTLKRTKSPELVALQRTSNPIHHEGCG